MLAVLFAVAALTLAVVGVYGVVAYSVTERRREFGVRLALGARATQVIALVAREGATLAATGLVRWSDRRGGGRVRGCAASSTALPLGSA